jgi:hypothetical protein
LIHALLVIAVILFVLWLLFHAAGGLVNLIWLVIIVLVGLWLLRVRARSLDAVVMAKQSPQSRKVVKLTHVPVLVAEATSDQAPGEEMVQVNDLYAGGGPPPESDSEHDQHQTGG